MPSEWIAQQLAPSLTERPGHTVDLKQLLLRGQVDNDLPGRPEVTSSAEDYDAVPVHLRAEVSLVVGGAVEEAAAMVNQYADPSGYAAALHKIASRYEATPHSQPKDRFNIEVAIKVYESVLGILPADDAARRLAVQNLILALIARSSFPGDHAVDDLDRALTLGYEACFLPSDDELGRSCLWSILAECHQAHFNLCGDRDSLDLAIDLLREVSDLCQSRSAGAEISMKATYKLASSIALRWNQCKDATDAEWLEGLFHNKTTSDTPLSCPDSSTPPSSPGSPVRLRPLSMFAFPDGAQGDPEFIQMITDHFQAPLDESTDGVDYGALFAGIANMHMRDYQQLGDHAKLDEAMMWGREALVRRPPGHPDRGSLLDDVAGVLRTRFTQLGDHKDLNKAISLQCDALNLCPVSHPERGILLNTLAEILLTRFGQFGDTGDLYSAASLQCEALELYPDGRAGRDILLNTLGNILGTRFKQHGNTGDLDSSISLHYEALSLRSAGHPEQSISLNNLASMLHARFKHHGDQSDLDSAVALQHKALKLHPTGHTGHDILLSGLANILITRYEWLGSIMDLNDAVTKYYEVLNLHPAGHPDHGPSLSKLASILIARFKRFGDRMDLDNAVTLQHESLNICPDGHPDRSSLLCNLAVALHTRYEQLGDIADLDRAVTLQYEALALCPTNHQDRGFALSKLAEILATRYKQLGDFDDLDQAATLQYENLGLPSADPSKQGSSLYNLANILRMRFEQSNSPADLETAIDLYLKAVELCPTSSPSHDLVLSALANTLLLIWENTDPKNDSLLDKFMDLCGKIPPGTQDCHWKLVSIKSTPGTPHFDPEAALILISELLQNPLTTTQSLLRQAIAGLQAFTQLKVYDQTIQRRVVEVYQQVISLMPQAAYLGLNPSQRLQSITDAEPAAIMAASHALVLHDVPIALEVLEQGRAVFWQQAIRLRTPLVSSQVPQTQQNEINQLLYSLDHPPSFWDHQDKRAIEQEEGKRWRHTHRLQELLKSVKEQFETEAQEHNLLPPVYTHLIQAAQKGPIVVLISTSVFSGAIIIKHKDVPDLVHFPDANPGWLDNWLHSWNKHVKDARALPRESTRAAHRVNLSQRSEHALLKELWQNVAYPVIQALKIAKVGSLYRFAITNSQ